MDPTSESRNRKKLPAWRRVARHVAFFSITAVAVFVATNIWGLVCDPVGLGGDCEPWIPDVPLATTTLVHASPPVHTDTGFIGHERFTAEEMNRLHPEIKDGFNSTKYRYVPADVPSTGPLVVSVNPIDRFNWGAAVLSDRNNYCYLELHQNDPNNPKYGGTREGLLPPGEPCVASKVTPSRIRSMERPYVRTVWWPYVLSGLTALLLGILGAGLARPFLRNQPIQSASGSRLRWPLYLASVVAMMIGLITFGVGLG